ncbi:MAG TPA: hypothetical protein VGI50_09655 [Solirubrobacteraceae bacterium]
MGVFFLLCVGVLFLVEVEVPPLAAVDVPPLAAVEVPPPAADVEVPPAADVDVDVDVRLGVSVLVAEPVLVVADAPACPEGASADVDLETLFVLLEPPHAARQIAATARPAASAPHSRARRARRDGRLVPTSEASIVTACSTGCLIPSPSRGRNHPRHAR